MEVPHSLTSSSPSSSSASGHTSSHLSFKKKISKSVNSATLRLQLKGISLSEAKSATKSAIRSSKYRIKEKSMDIWSRSKVPLRRGRKKSKELFETVRSSDLVTSLSSRVHKLAVVTQTHTKRLTGQSKEGDANDLSDEDEDDEYIFDSEFSFSSSEDEEHEGQVNGKSYDPCTGFYGMDREGNANYEPETTDDDEEEEDEDSVDKDSYLASNKLPQVECTSIRKLDEDHHLYYNNQVNHVYSKTSDGNKGNRNNSINNTNNTGLSNGKCMPKHCETSNYSNNNNCDVKSNNNYSTATTEGREDRRPHLLSTSTCTKLTSNTNKCNGATTASSTSLTTTTTATTTTPAFSGNRGDATNCKSPVNHQQLFHQQLTERLQLQRNKLQKHLNEKSESSDSPGLSNNNNECDHSKWTFSNLRGENNNKRSQYENIQVNSSNERSNLLYNSCIELCDSKGDRGAHSRNNKEKTISSTHDLMHVSSIQPSGKLFNNEKSRNNSTSAYTLQQQQQEQQVNSPTSPTSHGSRTTCNSSKVETDEVMKCRENSVKVTCEKNEKPLKPPKPPGLSSLPTLVNVTIAKNTLRRKTQRPSIQPPPPPPPPPPFNSLNCLTIEPPAEFSEGSTSEDKNEKRGEGENKKGHSEGGEVKVIHKEGGKGREGKLLEGTISSNNESMSQLNGKTKARQDLPALPPLPPPNNRPSVLQYAQRMLLKDGPSDETESNTLIPEAQKAAGACVSSSSSPPHLSSSFFSTAPSTASSHSCSSSSASTSSSSSSASTQYQVSYGDEDDKEGDEEDGDEASYEVPADSCPWFRPDLTRIEAEKFLLSSSLPDGSFVIRPGGSILYPYSLTLLSDGRTYHLNVRKVPGFDAYSLGKGSNGRSFDSLKSLVEYYSDKPLLLVSSKNVNSTTTAAAASGGGGGGNCITGGFNNSNHHSSMNNINNNNNNNNNSSSSNISNGNTGKKVNNPSEFSTSRKYVRLLLLK